MAKRFTSGAFAPSTVTEEERVAAGEAAAQAQQVDTQPGSVVLPTEQIEERVPSATTTVSTEALESTDAPNTPNTCLLYTSPSPRDRQKSRMPSSA